MIINHINKLKVNKILFFILHFQSQGTKWAVYVLFCAMCVIGSVIVLLLPEMNGRPLLQTVQEYESFANGCQKNKSVFKQ